MTKKSKLLLTRGLPGSGKSTYARNAVEREGMVRVNRDDLRMMMFGKKGALPYQLEKMVTDVEHASVKALLEAGESVVVDAMHLRPKYVREWKRLAQGMGVPCLTAELWEELDTLLERNRNRPRADQVPEEVIRSMFKTFTKGGQFLPVQRDDEPAAPDRVEWIEGLPDAILVDIDGTLALCGERDIYDLNRVHEDAVNRHVAWLVRQLDTGTMVFFMSGRSEEAREATEKWLKDKDLWRPWSELFMRADGDKRRDSIVKRELFDKHIRGNYNVRFCLDDRPQVIRMWAAMGLTVLDVDPTSGEF